MLRDRRLWLGVAAVGLLVLAWRIVMPSPAPATAPTAAPPRSGQAAASADPVMLRPVRLDALTVSREQPTEAERNPFRFQQRAAPAPRPTAPSAPSVETLRPVAPPAPAGPPPPPPIPWKFIGFVTRENGVKWAVLSDGKSAPQHGKEGDVIDGRYRILKIGAESIEIAYLDGRGRQTVRLDGK